jgi:hypothetical protein
VLPLYVSLTSLQAPAAPSALSYVKVKLRYTPASCFTFSKKTASTTETEVITPSGETKDGVKNVVSIIGLPPRVPDAHASAS